MMIFKDGNRNVVFLYKGIVFTYSTKKKYPAVLGSGVFLVSESSI